MFGLFKSKKENLTDTNEAKRCFESGRFKEALRRSEAIIEFAPEVAMSHRFKGEVLFTMERYSECHAAFLKAEELGGPGTEECFFWRALAHANAGNPTEAIGILKAFILSPNANRELATKCEAAINRIQSA